MQRDANGDVSVARIHDDGVVVVRSRCGGSDSVVSEGGGGNSDDWWMSGTGIFGGGRLLGNYRKPNRVQSATVGKFGYTTVVSCCGYLQLCRQGLVGKGGSSGRVRVYEVREYKGFQLPLYSVIYSALCQVPS